MKKCWFRSFLFMKKFFIILAALIILASACSAPIPDMPSLIEEPAPEYTPEFDDLPVNEPEGNLVSPGKLTVGTAHANATFCNIDASGNVSGADHIVMQTLARELGLELDIKVYDNVPDVFRALDSRSVDIAITMLGLSDERRAAYAMSVPYYYMIPKLYVRSEDYEIYTSIESFDDKKIGAVVPANHDDLYKRLTRPANLVHYKSFWELESALLSGFIDGFIMHEYYVDNAQYDKQRIAVSKVDIDPKAFPLVIYAASHDLMDEIDNIIAAQINNSTLDKYVEEFTPLRTRPEREI